MMLNETAELQPYVLTRSGFRIKKTQLLELIHALLIGSDRSVDPHPYFSTASWSWITKARGSHHAIQAHYRAPGVIIKVMVEQSNQNSYDLTPRLSLFGLYPCRKDVWCQNISPSMTIFFLPIFPWSLTLTTRVTGSDSILKK